MTGQQAAGGAVSAARTRPQSAVSKRVSNSRAGMLGQLPSSNANGTAKMVGVTNSDLQQQQLAALGSPAGRKNIARARPWTSSEKARPESRKDAMNTISRFRPQSAVPIRIIERPQQSPVEMGSIAQRLRLSPVDRSSDDDRSSPVTVSPSPTFITEGAWGNSTTSPKRSSSRQRDRSSPSSPSRPKSAATAPAAKDTRGRDRREGGVGHPSPMRTQTRPQSAHPSIGKNSLKTRRPTSARTELSEMKNKLNDLIHANVAENRSQLIKELKECATFFENETDYLVTRVEARENRIRELNKEMHSLDQQLQDTNDRARKNEKYDFVSDSYEVLLESISRIQDDIQQFDTKTSDDVVRAMSNIEYGMPTDPSDRIRYLVETKFRLLEQLIFVIKKRLHRYEEDEGMATFVSQYGSLEELLVENARLRQENMKLRLREQRFANDPLLKRRQLMSADPSLMRCLIFSLQNELAAHRNVIEKYDIERNPRLNLLLDAPVSFPDPLDFKDISDVYAESPAMVANLAQVAQWEEECAIERDNMDGDGPGGSLEKRLYELDEENTDLKNKVELLEKQLRTARAQTEAAKLSDDGIPGRKGQKALELEAINTQLVDQMKDYEVFLKKKDQSLSLNGELLEEANQRTALLEERAIRSTKRQLKMIARNKELSVVSQKLDDRFQALHRLSLALCQRVIQAGSFKSPHAATVIRQLYGDVLFRYVRFNNACLHIQAHARGFLVRRKYPFFRNPATMDGGKKPLNESMMSYQSTLGDSNNQSLTSTDVTDKGFLNASYASTTLGDSMRSNMSTTEKTECFPWLHQLSQVVLFSERDTSKVMEFNQVLKKVKEDLVLDLKPTIERELEELETYLNEQSHTLMTQLSKHFAKTVVGRASQTRAQRIQNEETQTNWEEDLGEEAPPEKEEKKPKKKKK